MSRAGAPPVFHAEFIKVGDRFVLPSGRAVQVMRTSRNGELLACRYLRLGALDLRSDAEVSLSALFLEGRGKPLVAAGRVAA